MEVVGDSEVSNARMPSSASRLHDTLLHSSARTGTWHKQRIWMQCQLKSRVEVEEWSSFLASCWMLKENRVCFFSILFSGCCSPKLVLAHTRTLPLHLPGRLAPFARPGRFCHRGGDQRSNLPRVDPKNPDDPVQSGLQAVLRTGEVEYLETLMF